MINEAACGCTFAGAAGDVLPIFTASPSPPAAETGTST
jgi:hypothetical protein